MTVKLPEGFNLKPKFYLGGRLTLIFIHNSGIITTEKKFLPNLLCKATRHEPFDPERNAEWFTECGGIVSPAGKEKQGASLTLNFNFIVSA